ncbi:Uncharacterized conserved protein [Ceraceosorus bombacis]|uniref:Uncharacterized conserved protein n=1 Tax=Ceraceosorus bombacis TaxID=401625 RepID=A0A0P1BDZ2_9BASI|nr:Uncharacterized conserved protein [Ceraceosorus bombacis]
MGGYELHQKLRTKAVRQLKKKDYAGAIESLHGGAVELLKEGEQGSGCDLGVYMIDVYGQAELPSDETSRGRILEIVKAAKPDFWRKKVIDAAIKWSAKVTNAPAGDGHLRLALGEALVASGDFYAAEGHLLAASAPPPGNASLASQHFDASAPTKFASSQLTWLYAHAETESQAKGESRDQATIARSESGRWALRGLLPLLVARAFTGSRAFLIAYVKELVAKHPKLLLPTQPNPKAFSPVGGTSTAQSDPLQLYMTANADLNFAQMTLALVGQAVSVKKSGQRVGDQLRNAWGGLIQQYQREGPALEADEFVGDTINGISTLYFDVRSNQPQGNFMQDMLGALMGGGPQGGSQPAPVVVKQPPAPKGVPRPDTEESAGDGGEELDLD